MRTGRLEFERILYDARQPHALIFGETARQLGARTQAISGEIDESCYDDLQRRWRIARVPVAGITDFRVLSLVQIMALDAGLRLVLRIHHCGNGPSMVHETSGPGTWRAASSAHLSHAGMQWSNAAARLVLSLAANEQHETFRAADMSTAHLGALDSRALVTWAIA